MKKEMIPSSATEKTQLAQQENGEVKAEQPKTNRRRYLRALRDLIIRIALLALVIYVLVFHLVGITVMPNGDMYPRIDLGDLVLYYRLEQSIHAQDVIVFEKSTEYLEESYDEFGMVEEETASADKPWWRKALNWLGFKDPTEPEKTVFICRVVAGPGDTVQISDGEGLVINGNHMIESGIFYQTYEYSGFVEYPLELGQEEYFVLADYRNGGADSRFFGAVKEQEILGTVITIMRRNNL